MLNYIKILIDYRFTPIIFWFLMWQIMLLTYIGSYTSGPNLITWWDAIWMPQAIVVVPFVCGWIAFGKKRT